MPGIRVRDIEIYYEIHGSGPRLFFIGGSGGDLRDKPGVFDGPLTLWDISDLSNIQGLDSISTGSDRCVHNGYFDGDSVLAAWYIDGIFSFKVESGRLVETGHYDTYPGEPLTPPDEESLSAPPIEGAWGLWSFGEHLIVGDTERGMMIFDHYPELISSR